MALKKLAKTAKGETFKWSTAATWSESGVPTEADDVELNGEGTLEIAAAAKCRSFKWGTFKGKLKHGAFNLAIGGETAPEGEEPALMEFGSEGEYLTVTGSKIRWVSTVTTKVQTVTTAGRTLPEVEINGIKSGSLGGKYKLLDKMTAEKVLHIRNELNTNGQECKWGIYTQEGGSAERVFKAGKSIIKLTGTGAVWLPNSTGFTGSFGESTIEIIDASNTKKLISAGGAEYGTFIVANGTEFESKITIKKLANNSASKPTTCKATLTALSNHLVVTSGESNLFEYAELEGVAIPAGTHIVKKIEAGLWEMSENASETVAVAETVTIYGLGLLGAVGTGEAITVTEEFTTNGKAGELSRLASTSVALKVKITKATERVVIDYMRIRNSEAEGTEWYAGTHSVNVAKNVGWKFEAPIKEYFKTLSYSQVQEILLPKQAGLPRSLTQSQTIPIFEKVGIFTKAISAGTAPKVINQTRLSKTLTQTSNVSGPSKTPEKIQFLTQGSLVTLPERQLDLTKKITQSQVVSALKFLPRSFLITVAQTATVIKQIRKILSIEAFQNITTSKILSYLKTLVVKQEQVLNVPVKFVVAETRLVLQGASVSVSKRFETLKTIAQAQVSSRQIALSKSLKVNQETIPSFSGLIQKILKITQAQSVINIAGKLSKVALSLITQAQSVTVEHKKVFEHILTVVQEVQVARQQLIEKSLGVIAHPSASLFIGYFRNLLASQNQTAKLSKQPGLIRSATQNAISKVTSINIFARTLAIAQTSKAALKAGATRTLFALQESLGIVGKTPQRRFTTSQNQSTTALKSPAKSFLTKQEQQVLFVKFLSLKQFVSQEQIILIGRGFFRTIRLTQETNVTLNKAFQYFRTLAVGVETGVRIAKNIFIRFLIPQIQNIILPKPKPFTPITMGSVIWVMNIDEIIFDSITEKTEFIEGQSYSINNLPQWKVELFGGTPNRIIVRPATKKALTGTTNDPQWQ